MHLWVVRKSDGVAERRYCGIGAQLAGKVTGGGDLLSGGSGISSPGREIIVLF
jgi:hypothetical protein